MSDLKPRQAGSEGLNVDPEERGLVPYEELEDFLAGLEKLIDQGGKVADDACSKLNTIELKKVQDTLKQTVEELREKCSQLKK